MKTKFTLLTAFLAAFFTGFAQQFPNAGFENFTNPYTPAGWIGIEDLSQNAIGLQYSIFTFQDSTTFTEGAASLKLVTDTIPFYYQLVGILPGLASLGTGTLDNSLQPSFTGIPFTYRPDSIIFDYKYTTPGGDTGAVNLKLTRQSTIIFERGMYLLPDSNWVHMAIPLTGLYNSSDFPDVLLVQFVSSNPNANPVIGSTLHVDAVKFGYVNPPIPASITASGPLTFCNGDSVTLHANSGTGYSYKWSRNDTLINGATASSYVATTSGLYTVEVDSASSAANSFGVGVTVSICNGINELASAQFSVYPNPASNLLNITSTINMADCSVQMFDVLGRTVLTQSLTGTNNIIDVAKLVNGTYVYRIVAKDNSIVSQNKFTVVK